ncbi:MAG TPA: 16S rRNA (cytidine(1402)-2'-O)-methyltransferase [Candidatus Moranbacteria bacterium]|nr:16S rRNA (cytidine(1402)-2'-O)-methyltransferase [Candidatus Moranbacteria bacterium]HBY10889.1 16S rRNA (cytidine(1402)-2'-O)-methyltransferase [Candidatus Moranbacteria bacterium]
MLYIVATPIGNLKDITFRAVETLQMVDLIVCEDTRNSRKLLEHYEIKTPTMSFYQNIRKGGSTKPVPKLDLIVQELKNGKNVALITDAGTPGISDPGNQLVASAVENDIVIVPIPGASTVGAMISVAGIDLTQFVFLGFPPHKKGRETFFKKVVASEMPVMYFESPHRVIKNLELLKSLSEACLPMRQEKKVILGRELTKMFEEIVRGNSQEILEYFEKNKDKIRGEFVVIVY